MSRPRLQRAAYYSRSIVERLAGAQSKEAFPRSFAYSQPCEKHSKNLLFFFCHLTANECCLCDDDLQSGRRPPVFFLRAQRSAVGQKSKAKSSFADRAVAAIRTMPAGHRPFE